MFREAATTCVRCEAGMTSERMASGHALDRCLGCGSAWMDTAEFLALLRHAQPKFVLDELMEHDDGSEHRPCPRCGDVMAIVWIDLLQLDQCTLHGVWFDPGELDRALRGDVMPRVIGPRLITRPAGGRRPER